ncbi:unnamed protein product, partial [Amoebophrya sp. A25]
LHVNWFVGKENYRNKDSPEYRGEIGDTPHYEEQLKPRLCSQHYRWAHAALLVGRKHQAAYRFQSRRASFSPPLSNIPDNLIKDSVASDARASLMAPNTFAESSGHFVSVRDLIHRIGEEAQARGRVGDRRNAPTAEWAAFGASAESLVADEMYISVRNAQ